jgi:hypothetical protein
VEFNMEEDWIDARACAFNARDVPRFAGKVGELRALTVPFPPTPLSLCLLAALPVRKPEPPASRPTRAAALKAKNTSAAAVDSDAESTDSAGSSGSAPATPPAAAEPPPAAREAAEDAAALFFQMVTVSVWKVGPRTPSV